MRGKKLDPIKKTYWKTHQYVSTCYHDHMRKDGCHIINSSMNLNFQPDKLDGGRMSKPTDLETGWIHRTPGLNLYYATTDEPTTVNQGMLHTT